ncbi:class I SAM-dependent methyltransferase [Microbacterium indicum]|uniref:class I SAM-dependent methyltransferase n=1 Tax=Microbacterium indicum TaxID=358100 RepID=UPI0004120590|nr:class I SAM-dependent methyltransferase [Microbacterium indicum]
MGDVGTAYDARSAEYIELLGDVDLLPQDDRDRILGWSARASGPILDAGCGPGHWAAEMGSCHEVVGVDLSAEFVASALARFPRPAFVAGDMARMPFPDSSFGGVLAWFSLIHSPDPGPALDELTRVLEPGGSMLVGWFEGDDGAPYDHAVATGIHRSLGRLTAELRARGLAVVDYATRRARRRESSLVARRA